MRRFVCVVVTAITLLTVGSGIASAAESCTYPTCPPPEIRLNRPSARPGQSLVVKGSFWCPGSTVTLTLGGVPVGTASVNNNGKFSQPFRIPADQPSGSPALVVTGQRADCGATVSVSAPLLVGMSSLGALELAAKSSEVPEKTSASTWFIWLEIGAVLAIFAVLFAPDTHTRRRRRAARYDRARSKR